MTSKLAKVTLGVVSLLICGVLSCGKQEESKKVEEAAVKPAAESPLTICLGGIITPKRGTIYYHQLLDYIGKKINRPVKTVEGITYQEINNLLKLGQADAGFVCAGPYVDGHNEFGLELLVAPQTNGQTVYYSYIIVPKDSPVKSFAELRGKTFAFTDPNSNSGKLVPTYMLAKMKETPDSFFKKYIFSYAHDKSIELVAQGMVDGAAVDSLIWEYDNQFQPENTSRTKIIEKSDPYGIPPITVRKDLDAETKEKLRQAFLNMHSDPEGQSILKNMLIDKFVVVNDNLYDSIRQIQTFIDAQKK